MARERISGTRMHVSAITVKPVNPTGSRRNGMATATMAQITAMSRAFRKGTMRRPMPTPLEEVKGVT